MDSDPVDPGRLPRAFKVLALLPFELSGFGERLVRLVLRRQGYPGPAAHALVERRGAGQSLFLLPSVLRFILRQKEQQRNEQRCMQ